MTSQDVCDWDDIEALSRVQEFGKRVVKQAKTKSKRPKKSNKERGNVAESLTIKALIEAGYVDPFKTVPPYVRTYAGQGMYNRPTFYITETEKTRADIVTSTPTGQMVLVEVKTTDKPKLSVTAFKHYYKSGVHNQLETLLVQRELGREVLVAWVYQGEVKFLDPARIVKGKPVKWQEVK